MFKALILFIFITQFTFADNIPIAGKWHTATRSLNKGTEIIEKEYLTLYPNSSFELLLLVSLKKGEAYINDLRIEVSGTWESRHDVLVYVIKNVNVPEAKEVYLISQKSLEDLAASFKYRYENDKIHISKILSLQGKELRTVNEKGRETLYKR